MLLNYICIQVLGSVLSLDTTSILTSVHFTQLLQYLLAGCTTFVHTLGYSVFYVGIGSWNYYDRLIFWTQDSPSFMVLSSFLYYYLRWSTPACILHKIVTVIIRALFKLSCVTQRKIAVRHYPAVFIVYRGVSLNISASESISGYGCCVFKVAYFEWAQLNKS